MIDSHCHLAGEEFAGDLEAVVQRARDAGLGHALVILAAEDDAEIERGARVRELWPEVRFSIGVHPHAAGTFADTPAAAAGLVENRIQLEPQARAVGEIGLDYHYDFAPRDVQQQVFREQIRLARRMDLPIVIHTREAEDDTFAILAEESAGEAGGVFHCFTGDRAMARRALDIGFHLSLAGIVTFPRALELREVAKLVPLDRLLIETDSPFLAPVPFRGTRNEPSYVTRVADTIGELRGIDPAAVGDAARANFERLFKP
ncbi:MAG TPA: TatD family hydrolase [Thermoanaerobaculia bacterium]|nr:TatD family hydrolase [Thermoanaerobaculia bacterium]